MTETRIETLKGMCAVALTRHLMEKQGTTADKAYLSLMNMELFALLMDTDSGMYLEQNEFLFECCDIEIEKGVDALYAFLQAA